MIDQICQTMIVILGGLTIFLLAQKGKWQRWGFVIGLISEIFWFSTSYINNQWGIFVLSLVYTVCYGIGIKNHWNK